MLPYLSRVLLVFVGLALAVFFQNCDPNFHAKPTDSMESLSISVLAEDEDFDVEGEDSNGFYRLTKYSDVVEKTVSRIQIDNGNLSGKLNTKQLHIIDNPVTDTALKYLLVMTGEASLCSNGEPSIGHFEASGLAFSLSPIFQNESACWLSVFYVSPAMMMKTSLLSGSSLAMMSRQRGQEVFEAINSRQGSQNGSFYLVPYSEDGIETQDQVLSDVDNKSADDEVMKEGRDTEAPIADALALCYPRTGKTVSVSNASELRSALASANPGDQIKVASGAYAGSYELKRNGRSGAPIVVSAANSAKPPKLSGEFVLSGNWGVLEGFEFTGKSRISIQGGDYNRVTRNRIYNFSGQAIYLNKSNNNRVDHNEITGKKGGGPTIFFEVNRADNNYGRNNRFDHNYLRDLPVVEGNGHEPIYSGSGFGAWMNTNLMIDHNLLDKVGSESEIIGIKTSGNKIIGNTLINSPYPGGGSMSNRMGGNNLWKNNWLEGSRMSIHGKNNQVIGNYVANGVIRLMRGNATHDQVLEKYRTGTVGKACDGRSCWPAAENVLVAGNTAPEIRVGFDFDEPYFKFPSLNTRLEGSNAKISLGPMQTGTVQRSTTSVDTGKARKLSVTDVGRGVSDSSCR